MASEMPSSFMADLYKLLHMTPNPDSSMAQIQVGQFGDAPASVDPSLPVLCKDVPVHPSNGTYVRLFLPRDAATGVSSSPDKKRLPLVIYLHGGGFIFSSVRNPIFHDHCSDLAAKIPALMVSVEYRLAPQHRLPAAYEDTMEALRCIGNTPDEWLQQHADSSNCYLLGGSAGANMVYHVGLRLSELPETPTGPLKIRGLLLMQPFFSGKDRTRSEVMVVDPIVPPGMTDLVWELSLPAGADRDHEYCNPTAGARPGVVLLDKIKAAGWRFLVTGCKGDQLVDRQVEVASMLEQHGIPVEGRFREGGHHGIDVLDPSAREEYILVVKDFISSVSNSLLPAGEM